MEEQQQGVDVASVMEIPIQITIEVGRIKMTIAELLKLSKGQSIKLEREVDSKVKLLANDEPFAEGELAVVDGKLGVRVTDISSPSARIKSGTGK